ncbi:MAG: cysteine desulfurase NifS [Elusimicrobia bacterium]|nr:MAG: cysteine desulfurase NifS [Elusimicrobiota bacterium]
MIYFDHNSTTPIRPEVVDAMLPFLRDGYGNPNSAHTLGQKTRKAIEEAREKVARLIGAADASEIVFTSCGSEADVMAVYGAAQDAWHRSNGGSNHLVTTSIEHFAVTGACRELNARGFKTTTVDVDENAWVDCEAIKAALLPETVFVSVMAANNEVGTIQPIAEIAALCREKGIIFHTDAVQAVGKIPIDVQALGVDLLALSGHKINAPKGVGALYIRKGVRLSQLIAGKQEMNRRGGTENTASIVGLGVAVDLARREMQAHGAELERLRDRLETGALALDGVRKTANPVKRLPGTSHLCFRGVSGHQLVVGLDLDGYAVSSGPACHSGAVELSHVLKAMRLPEKWGRGALRVSLGWGSTEAGIDGFIASLGKLLGKLRESAKI